MTIPVDIDGGRGEGGGQVLRSALALAICTGRPLRMENIRAGRRRPGLLRQHLTAARAAAEICGGRLDGAELGASRLAFTPGPVRAGDYAFAVGSAGSSCLVAQTVLPALLLADGRSRLTLSGGTHNPLAPSFDFLDRVFLPLVRRLGPKLDAQLQRPGFYPAGGGGWTLSIEPRPLRPFDLNERGELLSRSATAISAGVPGHVAGRELQTLAQRLGWPGETLQRRQWQAAYGPGNCLQTLLEYRHVSEMNTAFGAPRKSAERVANECARATERYLQTTAPVGEHLADQLLLPLALAGGGEFVGVAPSDHATTNAAVIEQFLPLAVTFRAAGDDRYRYRLSAVDATP